MKITLTYITRTPRTSAGGKPYTSLSIKTKEHGERFLSGFGNKDNEDWKVGDEVEIEKTSEVTKGDKTYLNFEMPKVDNRKVSDKTASELVGMSLKMGSMNLKLDAIIEHLAGRNRLDRTSDGGAMPNFEPKKL